MYDRIVKKKFSSTKKLDKNVWSNGMKIRVPGRKKQNNVKFTTPKITLKKKGHTKYLKNYIAQIIFKEKYNLFAIKI